MSAVGAEFVSAGRCLATSVFAVDVLCFISVLPPYSI